MKYTSRVQPFVSVSQKEADAIEMDQKLDELIRNKRINSHLKSRLYEDGMARLRNFREDFTEELVPPPTSMPVKRRARVSRSPVKRSAKARTMPVESSPILVTPLNTARSASPITPEKVDRGPYFSDIPISPDTPLPVSKKKKKPQLSDETSSTKRRKRVEREQKKLEIPSYMQPIRQKRKQGGDGVQRLYVRAWK